MFPENTHGELSSMFDVPPHLVWCDFQTLISFPIKCSFSTISDTNPVFLEDYFCETDVQIVFFIAHKKHSFRKGKLWEAVEQSYDFFKFWGLSFVCMQSLADTLLPDFRLDPYQDQAPSLCAELVYPLHVDISKALYALDDDALYALAVAWQHNILKAYAPPHPRTSRYWWNGYTKYQTEHFSIDYLLDFLDRLQYLVYRTKTTDRVFFAISY